MSDPIWVALITTWGAVLVAVIDRVRTERERRQRDHHIQRQLEHVAKDTSTACEQLQNSHRTNLRDDLDRLHQRVVAGFTEVQADISRLHADVSDLNRSDVSLWRAIRPLLNKEK